MLPSKKLVSSGFAAAASLNFEGWGANASVSAAHACEKSGDAEVLQKSMCQSSCAFTCVFQPTQAFQIPREAYALEPHAKVCAEDIEIDLDLRKAHRFIDRYGDHIIEGMQTLGGVMYLKMTTHLSKQVTESQMRSAMAKSTSVSASGGYGGFGVSVGFSAQYSDFEMEGSSSGAKGEKLQKRTTYEVVHFGPPLGDKDAFIKCLFMNNSTWHIIDRGLSRGSFVPVWELLEKVGLKGAAATVRLAWQQRTLRTKDLPAGTLQILQDSCTGSPPASLTPEVQATLDLFREGLRLKMKGVDTAEVVPYRLVEMAGDVLVFAARLEARLPPNSGAMKVLIDEDLFRTLIIKIITRIDQQLLFGRKLLLHVFCNPNKSLGKMKAAIIQACDDPLVTEFFNNDLAEPIHEDATAVPPVSLNDLPSSLEHLADVTLAEELPRLQFLAAEVVRGALCVAGDGELQTDYKLIMSRYPYLYDEGRGVFDFPLDRESVTSMAASLHKALNPVQLEEGARVYLTSVSGTFRTEQVLEMVGEREVRVQWDGGQEPDKLRLWEVARYDQEDIRTFSSPSADTPTIMACAAPHDQARFASDQPPQTVKDSLKLRLGLVLSPGRMLRPASSAVQQTREGEYESSSSESGSDDDMVGDDANMTIKGRSRNGPVEVASKDLYNIFQDGDLYEDSMLAQQLMELHLATPIFFASSSAWGEAFNLLKQDALRHTTVGVTGVNGQERILQVCADISLPRIAFWSAACPSKSGSAGMANRVFSSRGHAAFPTGKDADSDVSIELGVVPLLANAQDLAKPGQPCMVFVIKGKPENVSLEFTVGGQNGHHKQFLLDIFNLIDMAVVELPPDDPPQVDSHRGVLEAVRKVILGSQAAANGNSEKFQVVAWMRHAQKSKHKTVADGIRFYYGTDDYIMGSLSKEIGRCTLGAQRQRKPLSIFAMPQPCFEGLKRIVDTRAIKDDSTFRRSLQLVDLWRLEHEEKRRIALGSEFTAQSEMQSDLKIRKYQAERDRRSRLDPEAPAVSLLMSTLRLPTRHERLSGLAELMQLISRREAATVRKLQEAAKFEQTCYEEAARSSDDANIEACAKRWATAQRAVSESETGIEHVWRQLGLLYVGEQNVPGKVDYQSVPAYAAQILYDGGVLELVDGDAGCVNITFFKAVMLELNKLLKVGLERDPKVVVVSIAGVQSTGKSTLINTMFGCKMRTKMGCCTRGVNMALVPSRGWNTAGGNSADYILVLDTEGICNPVFQYEPWYRWHNNRLATFAVLAADVCILLSNNEDHTVVQQVLPFVMLVFSKACATLQRAGFGERHLKFVYNRVQIEKAEEELSGNRHQFVTRLHEEMKN